MRHLYDYMTESEYQFESSDAKTNNFFDHVNAELKLLTMEHTLAMSDIELQAMTENCSDDTLEYMYREQYHVYTEGVKDVFKKIKDYLLRIVHAIFGIKDKIPAEAKGSKEKIKIKIKIVEFVRDVTSKLSSVITKIANSKMIKTLSISLGGVVLLAGGVIGGLTVKKEGGVKAVIDKFKDKYFVKDGEKYDDVSIDTTIAAFSEGTANIKNAMNQIDKLQDMYDSLDARADDASATNNNSANTSNKQAGNNQTDEKATKKGILTGILTIFGTIFGWIQQLGSSILNVANRIKSAVFKRGNKKNTKEAKPEQAKPEQAKPEQAKPEQAKPEEVEPEEVEPEEEVKNEYVGLSSIDDEFGSDTYFENSNYADDDLLDLINLF